jgi:hypothetical protein
MEIFTFGKEPDTVGTPVRVTVTRWCEHKHAAVRKDAAEAPRGSNVRNPCSLSGERQVHTEHSAGDEREEPHAQQRQHEDCRHLAASA